MNETDVSLATKITIFTGLVTIVSGNIVSPCLPQIKVAFQDAPYSDFLVKAMFTLPHLFGGLASFFIGPFLDKWGRKTIIIYSLLLSTTGIIAFFIDSLYVILASRIFVGIGFGSSLTGFTTLLGDYFEGRRLEKFIGLRSAFTLLGNVFFLTIGGILSDINWRLVFLVYGISIFAAIGVGLFIEKDKTMKPSDFLEIKKPLPKSMRFIFIIAFLGGLPFCMVHVYTPFYLKALTNASATKIGLALAGTLVSGAITAMLYQKFRTYLSFQKVFASCLLSLSAGFFIIAASASYYHVVSGLLLVGVSFGLFMPTLSLLTVSRASFSNRGRAVGVLNICLSSGPFFALVILQPIARQIGIDMTFLAIGALSLISMLILRKRSF